MAAELRSRRAARPHRPQTNYFLVLTIVASLAVLAIAMPIALRAQQSDRAEQISGKLMCMCGCGQTLKECNHIDCPLRAGMFKEVDADVARGESDDLILQDFVQEYGEAVLAEPPAKGFNLVAWIFPGAAFAVGLCLVILIVRNWRRRPPVAGAAVAAMAGSASHSVDAEDFERARRQADRDTDE
ncbi:MAG: cytochrome c-type biogenesis protein [Candidatus Acidiferrales bacterium]